MSIRFIMVNTAELAYHLQQVFFNRNINELSRNEIELEILRFLIDNNLLLCPQSF